MILTAEVSNGKDWADSNFGVSGEPGYGEPKSWGEFLERVLAALPYKAQVRESRGRVFYRLPDEICCGSGDPVGLHLHVGSTGGLGARCFSNGDKLSGAGEDACTYWHIIQRLEQLAGISAPSGPTSPGRRSRRQTGTSRRLAPSGVTVSKKSPERQAGASGAFRSYSGIRYPSRALVWKLLVRSDANGFFNGAEFNEKVNDALTRACEKADVWPKRWSLKACRAAAASVENRVKLPTSTKRGAVRGYWGYSLNEVTEEMVDQLAQALHEERASGRLQSDRNGTRQAAGLTLRQLGVSLRDQKLNPRRRGNNRRHGVMATTNNDQSLPLPSTTLEDGPVPYSDIPNGDVTVFKLGVVRGNRATWIFDGRSARLPAQGHGLQFHAGPLERGIAIDLDRGAGTADPKRTLWQYRRVGYRRWEVTAQLRAEADPPRPGLEVQVITKAGEVHYRVLERVVERRSFGRLGVRYRCRVKWDDEVEARALERREVYRWNWLNARAVGRRSDWQVNSVYVPRVWPKEREETRGEEDRRLFQGRSGVGVAPHSVLLARRWIGVRESTFAELVSASRWIAVRVSGTRKAPVGVRLSDGGWVRPTSSTPHLWVDGGSVATGWGRFPAICLRDDEDVGPAPPVVILDVDYRPKLDVDGLGRGIRDAWFRALRIYPQSESLGGHGRHVLATVHPDDADLWEALRGEKIRGSAGGGAAIDLFPPGSPGYVALTRRWVGQDGSWLDAEWMERSAIPVLRVRQLLELPGGRSVAGLLKGDAAGLGGE